MESTILALEQAAMEQWRQGNPWRWAEISAEDVIYVDPGLAEPIIGLLAYKEYLKKIEGQVHYQGSEFVDPRVVVIGDAAVLSYNYLSTVLAPKGTVVQQTPWNATDMRFPDASHALSHPLPFAIEIAPLCHYLYTGSVRRHRNR